MAEQENQQPEFSLQRIYTKDISYEAPNTPDVFRLEWTPELKIDLQTGNTLVEEGVYEVTLSTTVTVSSKEKVAFLVEVKQAGIFTMKHFTPEQMGPMIGAVCPSILFPYVREVISDVVTRGGFPQLLLAPINFDALYAQQLQQQAQKETAEEVH